MNSLFGMVLFVEQFLQWIFCEMNIQMAERVLIRLADYVARISEGIE